MSSLSILIPTLNEPFSIRMLKRLNAIIDPQIAQYPGQIEKIIHDAGRSMATGTKRNQLIKQSSGEYFVFIDSDDIVSDDYISEIMTAIAKGPDVVTFNGEMLTNGRNARRFEIRLGSGYYEKDGVYYRWCNHLTPMRRDRVAHVKFPDVWVQEDYRWSKEINDRKLLKTEVHIDQNLYVYDFWNPKPRA